MKVILKKDIKDIGRIWDVVEVKNGFARNYLFPNKLAALATASNLKLIESQKKKLGVLEENKKKEAELLAERLTQISITIQANAGEEDKLFGSVTSEDLETALKNEGINLDKKQIVLDEQIKKLGVYQTKIKLHPEVTANLKFWVVKA